MRTLVAAAVCLCPLIAGAQFEFSDKTPGTLQISHNGERVADYVYQDQHISRPYFASVNTPGGLQVTRNQPPDPDRDIADHPRYHPGIWMSFGDLSGSDYWRLAANVKFVEFSRYPSTSGERGEFAARFRYLAQANPSETVCEELFHCTVLKRPHGFLWLWNSCFLSDREFVFGDQEEMGVGVRVATPLRVDQQSSSAIAPGTGTILDAEGRRNGAEIWGHSAQWCDFSGEIDGQLVGITIMCHPENFGPSWFHARDYGLLVANPFGRNAFNQGAMSRVVVAPGQKFSLRYGIFVHSGRDYDPSAAYRDYISLTESSNSADDSP